MAAGPSLARGDVHVWRADLARLAAQTQELTDVLSPDELERIARFRFERDRRRFALSRAALRIILGLYLGSKPESVRFTHNSFGKPMVDAADARGPLHFNASHSHELALYAFSAEHEVGVDVEHIRAEFASEDVAARFFSRREVEALRGAAPELRARAFFDCWARKEAYVKARGEGLSYPLDKFAVSLAPGETAALLCDELAPEETPQWLIAELCPADGYAAALAVRSREVKLKLFDLPHA
jgi:4'-phosphopantetheinyl transferase